MTEFNTKAIVTSVGINTEDIVKTSLEHLRIVTVELDDSQSDSDDDYCQERDGPIFVKKSIKDTEAMME